MRIIVTHDSPDMDAITSIWLIRRFLPGWEDATVKFVPAGERLGSIRHLEHAESDARQITSDVRRQTIRASSPSAVIETINGDEVIHVDTGLGPLDHHQIEIDRVSAASLVFDYVRKANNPEFGNKNSDKAKTRTEALERLVRVVVDIDHFKEVFWGNPDADYHEFSLVNILEGLKLQYPNQNELYVNFIIQCLDALVHEFENRIWAEKEIAGKGVRFDTSKGKGIGFETINDTVIKLSQKMGYALVIRKDPRKGYVRIKARPLLTNNKQQTTSNKDIDLTLAYEKLKKMDPEATWFLHVGKKMLLNGSVKNPKMRPTRLSLNDIIKVLKEI